MSNQKDSQPSAVLNLWLHKLEKQPGITSQFLQMIQNLIDNGQIASKQKIIEALSEQFRGGNNESH